MADPDIGTLTSDPYLENQKRVQALLKMMDELWDSKEGLEKALAQAVKDKDTLAARLEKEAAKVSELGHSLVCYEAVEVKARAEHDQDIHDMRRQIMYLTELKDAQEQRIRAMVDVQHETELCLKEAQESRDSLGQRLAACEGENAAKFNSL